MTINSKLITYLIGLGGAGNQLQSEETGRLIRQHRIFSGGDRHYELVKSQLPENHRWIPIKGKMEAVIEAYEQTAESVVIFASGDPYFYGFGNTLKKWRPQANVKAFPYFNCIQLLSHREQINYSEVAAVSVHGRSWDQLDKTLMDRKPLIGVLTDSEKTPAAIARRLLEYGFQYQMVLGEALESTEEKISRLSLQEASAYASHPLNCLLLESRETPSGAAYGIEDDEFAALPGRPGMITKKPIRLAALSALKLNKAKVFWDLGSCTGSMAIEAKRLFPALKIFAFEKRPECENIIRQNMRKFQCPGIQIKMGDVFDINPKNLPKPDALFIGGHGNRLREMILRMHPHLKPGGKLVINTVKAASEKEFTETCQQLGYEPAAETLMAVNDYNPIKIISAQKI